MKITNKVRVEFGHNEITNILVCYLQDKGIIDENVLNSNIELSVQDGKVKCIIQGVKHGYNE